MEFSYKIYNIGWADAHLEINGKTEYFSVSYLTNGLKDLLEGIMSLLPECMPEDEVKKQVKFEWYAEPGGSVWNIGVIDRYWLHIVIESYSDLDLKVGKNITLDEKCSKTEFIKCVLDEMDSILRTHGLVGYRETWYEHDFPVSAYLKLKNYLITGNKYKLEHIERYPGNEYSKSELKEELALLNVEGDNVS
jgi:hypothetical protein